MKGDVLLSCVSKVLIVIFADVVGNPRAARISVKHICEGRGRKFMVHKPFDSRPPCLSKSYGADSRPGGGVPVTFSTNAIRNSSSAVPLLCSVTHSAPVAPSVRPSIFAFTEISV